MVAATVDGMRIVSLYAPNGRVVGSPFYTGKLAWFERLARWIRRGRRRRARRSSSAATSTSPRPTSTSGMRRRSMAGRMSRNPSAPRSGRCWTLGLTDAYRSQRSEPGRFTWWDYRAGMFHKNLGMRIDHLLVSPSVASRVVAAEIDREARKGPPVPSDHAPLVIDLDEPGKPFDPDWDGALARIQARTKPPKRVGAGAASRRDARWLRGGDSPRPCA